VISRIWNNGSAILQVNSFSKKYVANDCLKAVYVIIWHKSILHEKRLKSPPTSR